MATSGGPTSSRTTTMPPRPPRRTPLRQRTRTSRTTTASTPSWTPSPRTRRKLRPRQLKHPPPAVLRPGLIRDSVRMTAEKGSAGMTAKPAAPPPAASHLRPGMLRDSRRLAHAPRRKMDFQKSVRQSLRKRRGHPGALLGHALRGQGGSGIGEERGGKRLYGARGEKAVAMDARSPWH